MTDDALHALRDYLDDSPIGDVLDCLSRPLSKDDYEAVLPLLPDEFQSPFALLFLGSEVDPATLPAPFRSSLAELGRSGLAHRAGGVRLGAARLHRIKSLWYFAQRDDVLPTLYLGEDSLALADRLPAGGVGSALDLCCGPGIQSLVLAGRGCLVTAVDANPMACRLATINAQLNGLDGRIRVVNGDAARFVPGEPVEFACANTPLLPIPDDVHYPFVGHGGPDGLRLVRGILERLDQLLVPGGVFATLGLTTSSVAGPTAWDAIRGVLERQGLGGIWTTVNKFPLSSSSPLMAGICATAVATHVAGAQSAAGWRDELSQVEAAFARAFRKAGATSLESYFLKVGDRFKSLERVDVSPIGQGPWEIGSRGGSGARCHSLGA